MPGRHACAPRALPWRLLKRNVPSRYPIAPIANPELTRRLQQKIDGKTKPHGALGALERLALQLGLIGQTESPRIENPHLIVCAGDHGVTAEGISAYPQDVTWQMVMNYLAGGAAVNVFAQASRFRLLVVDAGVNHTFSPHPGLIDRKVGMGTANMACGPAMTRAQCEQALSSGALLVNDLHSNGCTLVAFGEMGIGNTTSASALMARWSGLPLDICVGRGTGLDNAGLARKRQVVAHILALHQQRTDPVDVLAAMGGFEIAMIVGGMLAAAQARMTILVDGFIVSAALLAAQSIAPHVTDYCIFSHTSDERGHAALLNHLSARPLLALNLRLGEGTGAALALPLVEAAANFLNRMASFESAGVATRSA